MTRWLGIDVGSKAVRVALLRTGYGRTVVELLREDATLSMPPLPTWYAGRAAISAAAQAMIFAGDARGRWLCQIAYDGSPSTFESFTATRCIEWIRAAVGDSDVTPEMAAVAAVVEAVDALLEQLPELRGVNGLVGVHRPRGQVGEAEGGRQQLLGAPGGGGLIGAKGAEPQQRVPGSGRTVEIAGGAHVVDLAVHALVQVDLIGPAIGQLGAHGLSQLAQGDAFAMQFVPFIMKMVHISPNLCYGPIIRLLISAHLDKSPSFWLFWPLSLLTAETAYE